MQTASISRCGFSARLCHFPLFSSFPTRAASSTLSSRATAAAAARRHVFLSAGLSNKFEIFWRGRADDNISLVELLQDNGTIKSNSIAQVMKELDRGLFAPGGEIAYMDTPLPIGYNATISAPHMHASCLELLENHLKPGMRALDVGSGTGYLTAAFALMLGEKGYAVGVEHILELVQHAVENVKRSKASTLLEAGRLSFHVADGREGWPEQAPYDAIHVGAAASEVPQALVDQLNLGGRLIIPVGDECQNLLVIDKKSDGSLEIHSDASVRYVPLTSRDAQLNS